MSRVERSVEIAASLERVFEYVADHRNALRWMHNFTRFDPVPGTPTRGVGARVEATGVAFGFPVSATLEVVDFVENQRLTSRTNGRIKTTTTWSFEPAGEGTRVTFVGDYDVPTMMVRLVGSRAVEGELGKNTERSLANLKRNLESG